MHGQYTATPKPISQNGTGPSPLEIETLVALFEKQLYSEAEKLAKAMTARFPHHGISWKALGVIIKQQGRKADSLAPLRRAVELIPQDAELHCILGNALLENDKPVEAEASYRKTVEIMPGFLPAHFSLGHILQAQARFAEAITCYRSVLAIDPDVAEAHSNLGVALMEQGQLAEAEASFRQALQRRPEFAEAHFNLGNVLKEQGRTEEACISFDAAITLRPNHIKSHYFLSTLKTYCAGDPQVELLEQLRNQLAGLPLEAHIHYWFALGKVREDIGRYDEAFAAYQEGNKLQHARKKVDDSAEDALVKRIITVFSKEFFAAHPQPVHESKSPIFIVGMPRSGTSLLEQILATYPGIYGAGELSDLPEVVTEAMPGALFEQFPEAVSAFSPEDFKRIGEQYIERIRQHAPDAPRIVDKMLSNFMFIGMIHMVLPNAKIIHAMRDPMDSCFSSYASLFNSNNLNFAYDLGSLGRCYARYIKLMRHWHAVLPTGTILDVRYEDMVDDVEGQARRLLEYLGLPWDDCCLAFQDNKRQVKTISAAQVRKPIYKTSLARWKRFDKHLAPLLKLVKDFRD